MPLPGLEQATEPAQPGRAKRPRRSKRSARAESAPQPQPERVRLGEVTPGDWATLGDGAEVMVSWHARAVTFVRRAGGDPSPLPSTAEVVSVRRRRRDQAAERAPVVDPLVGGGARG